MANEITYSPVFSVVNGNYKDLFQPTVLRADQNTLGANSGILSIGTAEEDLAVTDIATNGWMVIHNLDATNYLTYGPKSAGSMVAFGKLKAGEYAVLRIAPSVTIRWLADTAAVKVKYLLLND